MIFLSSDVPDPTDFPTSGLRSLDALLRCTICGDFFDAPVTLPCGHCFCSACIRPPLAVKPECPNCRKAANELHLRPNLVMDGIQQARRAHLVVKGTPKKRKRSPEWTTPTVEPLFRSVAGPSKLRTPSSPTKQPKSPSRKVEASEDVVEIMVPSSDVDEDEISTNPTRLNPQDDDLVCCPICNEKVRYKILNAHMDNNYEDPPSAGSTSKTFGQRSWRDPI